MVDQALHNAPSKLLLLQRVEMWGGEGGRGENECTLGMQGREEQGEERAWHRQGERMTGEGS